MRVSAEIISSNQNPGIKNIVSLQKNSERRKQKLFTIEGTRELEKAIQADYEIAQIYFSEDIISQEQLIDLVGRDTNARVFRVTGHVYNKIAYREHSGGVIALAKPKEHSLKSVIVSENPLIVVIDGIEKPGNLGAIFRTADAAGIDLMIVTDPATDLYNPNAIRASLGCVFTVPVAIATVEESTAWLKNHGIHIYCSALQASVPYNMPDYTKSCALVMGTEASGLSGVWLGHSASNIIIPMAGTADSLNVSTAAAILIFEARRQRGFEKQRFHPIKQA